MDNNQQSTSCKICGGHDINLCSCGEKQLSEFKKEQEDTKEMQDDFNDLMEGFVDNYVDFAEMTKEQRDEVYNRLVLQTDNSLSEKDRSTEGLMNINIINEETAVRYEETRRHVYISLMSPGCSIHLPENDMRIGVVSINCHDLDRWIYSMGDKDIPALGTVKLFTEGDALAILKAVEGVDTVICQCEAGISRSAGVAAALAKIYNGDDEWVFKKYCPNMLVYRTILELFEYLNQRERTAYQLGWEAANKNELKHYKGSNKVVAKPLENVSGGDVRKGTKTNAISGETPRRGVS